MKFDAALTDLNSRQFKKRMKEMAGLSYLLAAEVGFIDSFLKVVFSFKIYSIKRFAACGFVELTLTRNWCWGILH